MPHSTLTDRTKKPGVLARAELTVAGVGLRIDIFQPYTGAGVEQRHFIAEQLIEIF